MAEKNEPRQPTHRAYSVIRREGQENFRLNLDLVFPHKDGGGFNIMLQALPLDGKIVCREITAEDQAEDPEPTSRPRQSNAGRNAGTAPVSASLACRLLTSPALPGLGFSRLHNPMSLFPGSREIV